MSQNKFEEYALLQLELDRLEEKKESLRSQIIEDMTARGTDTEKHSLGQFTIAKLKKWSYPQSVVDIETEKKKVIASLTDEIKSAKAFAESTGEATYEEQGSLRFTAVKL